MPHEGITRREALNSLIALTVSSPALVRCSAGSARTAASEPRAAASEPRTVDIEIDSSFAETALDAIQSAGDESIEVRNRLLEHPALRFLAGHREMVSGVRPRSEALLDEVLGNEIDVEATARVLDRWRGCHDAMSTAAGLSRAHLPDDASIECTLYLVIGYDIGVATPEGAALNVAHRHFVDDPNELPLYALHELHHVGFLRRRPMPALTQLDDATTLRRIIRFLTQMEGMAVHAAFAARERGGRLQGDDDYRLYRDEVFTDEVIARYRSVLDRVPVEGTLEMSLVGEVLEAMSSGERLWYRFGAIAARELERCSGVEALRRSVDEPEVFQRVCEEFLETE